MELNVSNSPPSEWEQWQALKPDETGFEQSQQWARTLTELESASPFYLVVVEGERVVASLMLVHHIPWDRERNRPQRSLRHWLSGTSQGWITWGAGPSVLTVDDGEIQSALRLMIEWVDEYAAERKVLSVKGGFAHTSQVGAHANTRKLFEEFGFHHVLWATYLVDLNQNEEELWRSLEAAARKAVKRARREGVKVEQIQSLEELQMYFFEPYRRFSTAFDRGTVPWRNTEVTWLENSPPRYAFYRAYNNQNETLAVLGVHTYNGTSTEISSAMSPEAFEMKIPAQDILHWEIFRDLQKRGSHTFDLAGVDPDPENRKAQGIRRFKKKWGGRYIEFNRFEKTYAQSLAVKLMAAIS